MWQRWVEWITCYELQVSGEHDDEEVISEVMKGLLAPVLNDIYNSAK